jgi:serine/threonine protein kinase
MLSLLDCETVERLELLGGDDIPLPEREWYESHLESCSACQERLDRADDVEPLRQLARQIGDPTISPPDPTLDEFLHQLREQKHLDPESPGGVDLYFLQATDRPELLGMLGPYEIQEVIGQGGMGMVLRAFEPALQRLVAVKVLAPALAGSATARRRFTREARASASVRHENIVTVHAVDEIQSLPYFVMEYVAGESLQELLDRNGPLELQEIVRIGWHSAAGLAAAHAQGLIHRDIKPANILLEQASTRIKITDFGLARMADDVQLTQNGVIVGTPEYMSPEQARGANLDHRTDLFSFGSVIYAMCTGKPPFGGSTTLAVLRSITEDTPRPVRESNPDIPVWLGRFIGLLLARERGDRLQSAAEAADLLERYHAHLQQPEALPEPELPQGTESFSPPARPSTGGGWKFRWPLLTALAFFFLGSGYWLFTLLFAQSGSTASVQFYHDFRGRPLPPEFEFYGAAGGRYFHEESEGFRITLPPDFKHPWGGTGLTTKFGLEGDFEITTTVEILNADTPRTGYGAGLRFYINKADSREGASFCRLVRPGDKQLLICDRLVETIKDGKSNVRGAEFPVPCTETKLQMRLKRKGTTLYYLWAPAGSKTFIEAHRVEFGSQPIKQITLTVINSQQPINVSVRLIDLRVAGGLTDIVAGGGSQPAEDVESSGVAGWVAGISGVLVLAFAGVWLFARRKNNSDEDEDEDEEDDDDEEDDEEEPKPKSVQRNKPQSPKRGPPGNLLQLVLPLLPLLLASLLVGLRLPFLLAGADADEATPAAAPAADYPHETYLSFTEKPDSWKQLRLLTPGREQFVKGEPEGLRITLPNGMEDFQEGVQLSPDVAVKGNFEITLGFEILEEPDARPLAEACGLGLSVELDAPTQTRATVNRTVTKSVGSAFTSWLSATGVEQKMPEATLSLAATKAKKGQLRFVRVGATLYSYFASEEGLFTLFNRQPFGAEPLKHVRIKASTGGSDAFLDARVTDLRIRSQSAPAVASVEPVAEESGGFFLSAVVIVAVLVFAVLGVWLYMRPWQARTQPRLVSLLFTVAFCLFIFVLGIGMANWFAPLSVAEETQQKVLQELTMTFQGPENAQGFDFMGPGAEKCVHFKPEGLRITLPAGSGGDRPPAGVTSARVLKGDFELTMRYEILAEPAEVDGNAGSRLSLSVHLNTPKPAPTAATINRSFGEKKRKVFVAWMSQWNEETQKAQFKSRNISTEAMQGELRMVRKGSVLSYYVTEKPGESFVLVQQYLFGTEDVKEIRIVGSTGDRKAALDVRITNLQIRAETIPGVSTPANPTATDSGALWISSVIALGLVLTGLGTWWAVGGNARTEMPPPSRDEADNAANHLAPAREEAVAAAEPPAVLSFECHGCKRRLKASAKLAGKKIKCPQCGTVVSIVETAIKKV